MWLGDQNFWSQIFCVRKKVIKILDNVSRCFIWIDKSDGTKKALVSWDVLYLPKACGGWNLKSMEVWCKASMLKLPWNIASKQDRLCVRWMSSYYIKDHNPITCHVTTSWCAKKILGMAGLWVLEVTGRLWWVKIVIFC